PRVSKVVRDFGRGFVEQTLSKNFFNQSGEIIGCPVCRDGKPGALHIRIETEEGTGYVHCEKMALLDMNIRRYSKVGSIHMSEIIDITDAIQGIFDYV
ncbi:MAG: hypothetical protein MR940_11310, partial [Lachnospiraceae bacterium]|nr:hypothetical protein [Lachnospiraceae bacterium]